MCDAPANSHFGDVFEGEGTAKPAQLAVHGLLCVYYEVEGGIRVSRVEKIFARLPVVPELWRFPIRLQSRHWAIGLAAAALIGLVFVYFRPISITSPARADLREVGYALPILVAAPEIDREDEALVWTTLESIAQNRALLSQQLATGSLDPDPWLPWSQVCRQLRAIGRWDEALAEMNALREYAEQREQEPERYTGYGMVLGDLASTYAIIGNYEQALEFRLQAIEYARDYQEWYFRTERAEDLSPLARARAMANTLAPQYWRLSSINATLGDVEQAWQHLHEAEALLSEYLRLECAQRELHVLPDATLVDHGRAVAETNHTGLESTIVKVREHLYNRAVLYRVSRDLDAAEDALDSGSLIPDYPFADESRLDFSEPMERLRIAIARGDFAAALTYAGEAEANTGPRGFDGYPPHPPIGIVARAELQFLHGVAKVGHAVQREESPREGQSLVRDAIRAVDGVMEQLPSEARARLADRVSKWIKEAGRVGVDVKGATR